MSSETAGPDDQNINVLHWPFLSQSGTSTSNLLTYILIGSIIVV